jgi:hypothetical protein
MNACSQLIYCVWGERTPEKDKGMKEGWWVMVILEQRG